MLKSLTMDIDAEVKEQNSFLERMQGGFGSASEALGKTMQSLDAMGRRGGTRLAMVIIVGIVGLFLVVWFGLASRHDDAAAADKLGAPSGGLVAESSPADTDVGAVGGP